MVNTPISSHPNPGRIFPNIQWSEEQKTEWKAQRETFYQQCKPIFEKIKTQFITTHYNWYVAVELESQDYFLAETEWDAIALSQNQHPNVPIYLFQINQTGVCEKK